MNYPDDPRVWGLGHQFLWGDDMLVAPVTREGATAWPVYFPAGVWHDFWTGARHEGPGGITVGAPLDHLPLFVRAGAIVPMGPVVQHTAERPLDEITLLIYPDGASRFELYEDDGHTNAYRRGHYALTTFECAANHATVTVQIGDARGDQSIVPAGRRYLLQLRTGRPRSVSIAGYGEVARLARPDQLGPGWWSDGRGLIGVRLPEATPLPTTVTVRI
jgi:alpha-glucosidase